MVELCSTNFITVVQGTVSYWVFIKNFLETVKILSFSLITIWIAVTHMCMHGFIDEDVNISESQ